MAENYKRLYEVTKKMLVKYQDEVVPELRKLLDERVEVVKCEDCKHRDSCTGQLTFCDRDHVLELNVYKYPQLEFCSYGERRESDADNRC